MTRRLPSNVNSVARRRFLLGLGGALALPLLPSIMGASTARAGSTGPLPKRFVFVFSANGMRRANWYPTGTIAWKDVGTNIREAPLTGPGGVSRVIGPEFAAVKSKLLLLRGLDFVNETGAGHFAPAPLSGYAADEHVTIDQLMARSQAVYPTTPTVRSLHLLVQGSQSAGTPVSISNVGGAVQEVPHQTALSATFERLFGGFNTTPDPNQVRRDALRASIVGRFRGEYEALSRSPRLGVEEKQRLDAHITFLRDLEAKVKATGLSAACTKPGAPTDLAQDNPANIPLLTTANIDLAVAAIRCDRTRVVTIMLCPPTDTRDFSFLAGGGVGQDHHSLSHQMYDAIAEQKLATIDAWYGKQVADLLTKLDVMEDPTSGKTFLDNSVVYWGNENAANDGDAHTYTGMPVLLAGGCGGYFRTGRYIDYRHNGTSRQYDYNGSPANKPDGWDYVGRPYNSLLLSLMTAMGLTPGEWESGGQIGFGDYRNNYRNQYSVADATAPLPALS